MSKKKNNFLVWFAIILVFGVAYQVFSGVHSSNNKIAFSEFLARVESGNVRDVFIYDHVIEGKGVGGLTFTTLAPMFYPGLIDKLISKDIRVEIVQTESMFGNVFNVLISWFPVLLLAGIWIYFIRNVQGGGKAMGFGKSKAKLISDSNTRITFAEVAGAEEAKDELQEIVEFLKEPQKFQKLGGKIPRGCLLVGAPGTGKTLLAKAVAGEAKVPFFIISGSDFVEMFVGVGASRVRDMFTQAKKLAPCIVFIDEIDAVGRHRGAGLGGGNDEREQTLNQLLVEMDGFSENLGVIVIAATNRPDVLDPALLRPGRFDRRIIVPIPDVGGREQILKVHLKKVPLSSDVEIKTLARGTPGFAGADLANIVNEAALMAAKLNKNSITMKMLEHAKDKVLMGSERRSMMMTQEQKRIIAYHEGGHALMLIYTPASDPVHKATIIPRGMALGVTMHLPDGDRHLETRERLKANIAVSMGGRVAEELIFGYDKTTVGAVGDIKSATQLARQMVTQWGLSDKIGPILVGNEKEEVFLGHTIGRENHVSDSLAQIIDEEIKKAVEEGYQTAREILTEHIDELHKLANALLEYETLSGEEINNVIKGKPIKVYDKKENRETGVI